MTRAVVAIPPGMPATDAARLLAQRKFRRLVVIDDGRLVGIVTKNDLARAEPNASVATVMAKHVVTVTGATPFEEAVRLMVDRKIGALPVLDAHGHVAGIITESDAMRVLIASIALTGPGVRLTFRTTDSAKVIEHLVASSRKHRMSILALLVTDVEGEPRVLAKLAGPRADDLIADAWRAGFQVLSAQKL